MGDIASVKGLCLLTMLLFFLHKTGYFHLQNSALIRLKITAYNCAHGVLCIIALTIIESVTNLAAYVSAAISV